MNIKLIGILLVLAAACGFGGETPKAEEREKSGMGEWFEMDAPPDGHYLVEMAQEGKTFLVNLQIVGGKVRCVKGERKEFVGMAGESKKLANGVFIIRIKNGSYGASQIWAFGTGNEALATETPDRGERHRVWRVKNGKVLARPE